MIMNIGSSTHKIRVPGQHTASRIPPCHLQGKHRAPRRAADVFPVLATQSDSTAAADDERDSQSSPLIEPAAAAAAAASPLEPTTTHTPTNEENQEDGTTLLSKSEDIEETTQESIVALKKVTWRVLFSLAASKVKTNIWSLLLVHFACDAFIFALHRCSHRFTNELAIATLGGGALTPAAIGNMWWLSADSAIANFQTGYQALTFFAFLLAFPLNVLLKTLASTATILICSRDAGAEVTPVPWWRPFAGMRHALPAVRSIWGDVAAVWRQIFVVELMISAAVIPLQFASLAVITLPFTLPLILSLYAAAPAAVLEGKRGWEAIRRSRALMQQIRWQLVVPFVGMVVAQRVAEAVKGQLLATMPPRFYKELVEIPAALLIGGFLLSVWLSRVQDVLPFVAFTEAKRKEEEGEGEGGELVG